VPALLAAILDCSKHAPDEFITDVDLMVVYLEQIGIANEVPQFFGMDKFSLGRVLWRRHREALPGAVGGGGDNDAVAAPAAQEMEAERAGSGDGAAAAAARGGEAPDAGRAAAAAAKTDAVTAAAEGDDTGAAEHMAMFTLWVGGSLAVWRPV
jgi:hypothetical protein